MSSTVPGSTLHRTKIHLLYGYNGSGKSHYMRQFAEPYASSEVLYVPARQAIEGLPVVGEQAFVFIEHPFECVHPQHKADSFEKFLRALPITVRALFIESHSEVVALRAMRLVREGALRYEDVDFIVFQGARKPSVTVGLDRRGNFTKRWPAPGFFPERRFER